MRVRVELCDKCTAQLRAFKERLGEPAMATMAAAVLQSCPECRSKLPPTEGQYYTKLASDDREAFPVPASTVHVDDGRR
jgi:hypothetical protein